MKEVRTMFVVDSGNTLAEAWQELATSLIEAGAQEFQLDAMRMTFFMGAAQTHTTIDTHSRGSRDEFVSVMNEIRDHINDVLTQRATIHSHGGHA
jgi:hypothetical protein